MWFDELMDDFKSAMQVSNDKKSIFAPIFINLGFAVLFGIYCILLVIVAIASMSSMFEAPSLSLFLQKLPLFLFLGLFTYLVILAGRSLLEAGSLNMYKTAINGIKPSGSDFFGGIKSYFFKILGGFFIIDMVVLLLSPILLTLYLLFAILVGTLTAGWGIVWLTVVIMVYLQAWTMIVVMDGLGPVAAIRSSFRFARKNYRPLFVLMLCFLIITKYAVLAFGFLPAILAGWFFGGIATTYFRMVLLTFYKRKKEELV